MIPEAKIRRSRARELPLRAMKVDEDTEETKIILIDEMWKEVRMRKRKRNGIWKHNIKEYAMKLQRLSWAAPEFCSHGPGYLYNTILVS